jgi:hypothetical protein
LPRMAKSLKIFRLPSLCHIAIRIQAYKSQNGLTRAITAKSWAMTGQTASNLPIVCGVEAATCTRSVLKNKIHLPHQHAATASWRK